MKNVEKERIMSAKWMDIDDSVFNAHLYIECDNKNTMITQITGAIANMGLSISTINAKLNKNHDQLQINIGLEIRKVADIETAIKKLSSLKGVAKVERSI